MTNNMFQKKLLEIKNNNNYRELKYSNGIDFSSNDYLGLSNHPKIKEAVTKALQADVSIGSGGSRLLTGNKKEHVELEEFAAKYFGAQACLFFNSGFLANYSLFTTLPDRKDFIIYDELSHASIREGINGSNSKSIKFKHNDLKSLKEAIEKAQSLGANSIWLAVESVYSMDGDITPLSEILEIINPYKNIWLVVDEAHATGIFGKKGKGFSYNLNYEKLITLHTCSKALGVSGALVCGGKYIIKYLINKSRPFIYTTAESPIIAIAVKEALNIVQEESCRRENLLELIEYTHKTYSNIINRKDKTQIIPIILKDSQKALDAASYLQKEGFDVRAVRPPTVPSARLRVSLNTNLTKKDVDRLFEHIKKILEV